MKKLTGAIILLAVYLAGLSVVQVSAEPEKVYIYPRYHVLETIDDLPKASGMMLQDNMCLPVAQSLQQAYLDQGILTSIAVARWNQYAGVYVTESGPGPHAGLLVETFGGWYFVDPIDWKTTLVWR